MSSSLSNFDVLSRSEMKNVKGGSEDGCNVSPIRLIINDNCTGRVCCGEFMDQECYDIPCCSDFGQDVGWCEN
jgi:hypothetical protein